MASLTCWTLEEKKQKEAQNQNRDQSNKSRKWTQGKNIISTTTWGWDWISRDWDWISKENRSNPKALPLQHQQPAPIHPILHGRHLLARARSRRCCIQVGPPLRDLYPPLLSYNSPHGRPYLASRRNPHLLTIKSNPSTTLTTRAPPPCLLAWVSLR